MIFGLPGAALAMYRTAATEKKKAVSGLLLSAALTSMITGITEPLEFTFLFVAPLLYGIHCVLAGFAYMLMHVFQVGVGMTFSGGFIDLFLFGILQGNRRTSWLWILVVGAVYFFVYYFLFSYLIRKLDLKTPGRENSDEVKLYTRADVDKSKEREEKNDSQDEISAGILKGLGGKDNISDVDCCATRLRCTVYRAELVDDNMLKATGASGVVHKGNGVQIIYGPRVTVIKSNFEDYLENIPKHVEEPEEVEKKVKVTNDLKYAKVYVSILNAKDNKQTLAALKKSAGFLRSELAKKVNLRNTPELVFELDDSLEYGAKIDSILKEILPKKEEEN